MRELGDSDEIGVWRLLFPPVSCLIGICTHVCGLANTQTLLVVGAVSGQGSHCRCFYRIVVVVVVVIVGVKSLRILYFRRRDFVLDVLSLLGNVSDHLLVCPTDTTLDLT